MISTKPWLKTGELNFMTSERSEQNEACRERNINITLHELPLSCPRASDRIWDAHPRVYLPIEEQKQVICPYCGTQYHLEE
jgi:uncharacterized Zn-finger protein